MKGASHQIFLGGLEPSGASESFPTVQIAKIKWNKPSELRSICREVDVMVHVVGKNVQVFGDSVVAIEIICIAKARVSKAKI